MNRNHPDDDSTIEFGIFKERLRQAHHSFNAALVVALLSTCISLLGAGLILSGKLPEGGVTTSAGIAITFGCFNLAKDANNRLDRIRKEQAETKK